MSATRNILTDAEIEMIERIAHAAGYREAVKDCSSFVARRGDSKLASELRLFSRNAHLLEPETKACAACGDTGWERAEHTQSTPCQTCHKVGGR